MVGQTPLNLHLGGGGSAVCRYKKFDFYHILQRESIPVGCVPPAFLVLGVLSNPPS